MRTVSAELPSLIEFERLPREPEAGEEDDPCDTSGVMMRVEFLPFQRTDRPVPGAERSRRIERTEELPEGVLKSPCAPAILGFTRGMGDGEGVDVSRATAIAARVWFEEEGAAGSVVVVGGDVDDVLGCGDMAEDEAAEDVVGVAMVNSVGILDRRNMLRGWILREDDATLLAMDVFDSLNAPFDNDIGCVPASTGWVSSESTRRSLRDASNAETERLTAAGRSVIMRASSKRLDFLPHYLVGRR